MTIKQIILKKIARRKIEGFVMSQASEMLETLGGVDGVMSIVRDMKSEYMPIVREVSKEAIEILEETSLNYSKYTDPIATMRVKQYNSYVEVGFTPEQAFQLIMAANGNKQLAQTLKRVQTNRSNA